MSHIVSTILLAQGTHPKVVQELLGGSTITLPSDTYSHITPALHEEVAEKMKGLLKRAEG